MISKFTRFYEVQTKSDVQSKYFVHSNYYRFLNAPRVIEDRSRHTSPLRLAHDAFLRSANQLRAVQPVRTLRVRRGPSLLPLPVLARLHRRRIQLLADRYKARGGREVGGRRAEEHDGKKGVGEHLAWKTGRGVAGG